MYIDVAVFFTCRTRRSLTVNRPQPHHPHSLDSCVSLKDSFVLQAVRGVEQRYEARGVIREVSPTRFAVRTAPASGTNLPPRCPRCCQRRFMRVAIAETLTTRWCRL